jgi:hypothetical protein
VVRQALTFVSLLVATSASAADFQGRARLWVGPAYDSNAPRDFVSASVATQPDLFLFGLAQLEGVLRVGERFRFQGSYDLSGRKFIFQPREDTLVQAAQLEGTVAFANYFAFGLSGRGRDRRGAERDYTDLQGGALLDFFPSPKVELRVQVNAHRFWFYNRPEYGFFGPDGTFSARYRFDRRHSVSVFGAFNPRLYDGDARNRPLPEGSEEPPARRREDAVFGAGLTYAFRGPFHFSFSYSYFDQTSNSYGESIKRHRLNATGGFRLPWELTLLTSLTWQPSIFPEGVFLSPELTVLEEDENVSSLTVKLVKPLGKYVDLDVRYAGFLGFLPENDFVYVRHVVSAGVAVNF